MADSNDKPKTPHALLPYILLILSQACFASNHIMGRMAEGVVPPLGLSFWRWAISAAILLPFAAGGIVNAWPAIVARWKPLVLTAFVLVVMGNSTIYVGLNYTTAINASIIAVAQPALTFVFSWLIYRETITPGQGIGAAIALIGVLTVLSRGNPLSLADFQVNIGDLFIVCSVIGLALYSILLREMPPELTPVGVLVVLQVLGALLMAPLYAWESIYVRPMSLDLATLAAVLWAALIVAIAAMWLWNAGVAAIGANKASVYVYVRLFFVTAAAILILGEKLHLYHFVAFALVFAGIWLVSRARTAAATRGEIVVKTTEGRRTH